MSTANEMKSWLRRHQQWKYGQAYTSIEETELTDTAASKTKQLPETGESKNLQHGWRRVIIIAAIITAAVLLLNITFAIFTYFRFTASKGVGHIYQGNCVLVERWNTAFHLLINALGTVLLAASSFTMQCLSSPTRSEVDVAHSRGRPMDIGVPSIRNLFYSRYWKGLIWLGLCLTTLPLHFL